MISFYALALLVSPLLAHPTNTTARDLQKRAPFEWTAWGDSYASGVGAGKYIGGRRCLRYREAYPIWISDDPEGKFPDRTKGKFNNVVCSGAKTEDVEKYQFYTEDQSSGQPGWQFYPRPASGKPTMGTLTVGGDDVDFPGILNNCIMEGFPIPLSFGLPSRSCDKQREITWSLIADGSNHDTPNPNLVNKIDKVIKKIVDYGKKASGDQFRLYVTGYGQFFNDEDPACNDITFARTANPVDDKKPHQKMTTEIRKDFNQMSRTLNAAITQAVELNKDQNVKFVDIDGLLTGHRFCEPGVKEPDQNNVEGWFMHYPYDQAEKPAPGFDYLNSVAEAHKGEAVFQSQDALYVDQLNEFWSQVDEQQLSDALSKDPEPVTTEDFWGGFIGTRVRVFHPKMEFHKAIYRTIVDRYRADELIESIGDIIGSLPPITTPDEPEPEYASGTCHMHVDEYEIACLSDKENLQANINIWDAKGVLIGSTPKNGDDATFASEGYPGINAENPFRMKSKLPADLVVSGQHAGDYIQFSLDTEDKLWWTSRSSKEDSPDAWCKNGGWDPRSGAGCSAFGGITNAKNQMDCWFKC